MSSALLFTLQVWAAIVVPVVLGLGAWWVWDVFMVLTDEYLNQDENEDGW